MSKPLKYAVFGAGSWATAIVKMLCENLEQVGWYMRNQSVVDYIKETIKKNLNTLLFESWVAPDP